MFQPKQKADLPHSSGIYTPEWVDKLYRGVVRHGKYLCPSVAVVTDVEANEADQVSEESWRPLPFVYPERDWSSLMEMFRPLVVGPEGAILVGLDTIIVGDLTPIEEACKGLSCIAPLDPYHAPQICNAAVYVSQEKAEEIWDKWTKERDSALLDSKYRYIGGKFSEMVWLRHHLNPDAYWDDLVPGAIQSWKVGLNQGPPREDTKMVYFHGKEKPHTIQQDWIKEHWR